MVDYGNFTQIYPGCCFYSRMLVLAFPVFGPFK
jgi:hypothetical protein